MFLLLLWGCGVSVLFSQKADTLRPKIGLVLSGGAAKGIAHVGVLKTLEEAGIRPDIITGTSMGSIIGGLYAMGYPADTLEQLILSQDWDKVLSDRIPLEEVIFEEKPFFENALIEFPFVGWLPETPSGLIYGQQISKLLNRLTVPAFKTNNFEELPIPFCGIGADIFQGKPVILADGHLAESMRASMAIPTVFTPIRQDSVLLVDGGLLHNFPVAEAKALGADIIIGVYTGRKLADKEDIDSFPSILAQAIFLLGIRDAEKQRQMVDLYIEPELKGYGPEDFSDADTILQRGYQAGQAKLEALRHLADSVYQLRPRPDPIPMPRMERIWVDSIVIVGNRLIPEEQIRGKFGLMVPAPLSIDDIETGLDNLYGTNFFERVYYELKRNDNITYLLLHCDEKRATTLRFAVNYDSYLKAGLLFNLTFRNSLFPSSRFIFFGKIAENYRFGIHYLKYLDNSQQFYVTAGTQINRDVIPIYENGIRNEEFRLFDFISSIQINRRVKKNSVIGIGGEREQLSFRPLAGTELPFQNLNYTNLNVRLFLKINTLDRNIFPTQGTQLDFQVTRLQNYHYRISGINPDLALSADSLFGFKPYYSFKLNAKSWIPLSDRSSLSLSPFAGIVIDPSNRFSDFFLVGAPDVLTRRSMPFHGLDPNEVIAQFALGSSLGYQYFPHSKWILSTDMSLGYFTPPTGLGANPQGDRFRLMGASLSVGYNSFMGPVRVSFMYPFLTEGGVAKKLRTYISIGHRF